MFKAINEKIKKSMQNLLKTKCTKLEKKTFASRAMKNFMKILTDSK